MRSSAAQKSVPALKSAPAQKYVLRSPSNPMPNDGPKEFREVMDIRLASEYLDISPDTLYKYASEGFVPAFKLGNRWRFKKSRLDDWMDQQSDASMARPEVVIPTQKKPVRAAR